MTDTPNNKILLSITPLARIPLLRDQSFFYTSSQPVTIGSLVSIPIGRRTARGIVIDIHPDFERAGGITLKPIKEVLAEGFLTKAQITLAQFISRYYYCPLGIVFKHFVPERRSARKKAVQKKLTHITPLAIPSEEQKVCDTILAHFTQNSQALLRTTHNHSTHDALVYIIQKQLTQKDGQILVLVPERTHIPIIHDILTQFFPEEIITTLSTTITKGQYYENWQKTAQGTARIVLGTRTALFAPFADLAFIIMTESHDMAYKQWDMNPRYDTTTCSQELARIHGASVLSLSASPRIHDIHEAESAKAFFALPESAKPRIDIVDMKIEYWEQNEKRRVKVKPLLSQHLIEKIKTTLGKKEQILLFINQQGKSAFSVCTRCKTVARCPTCERALVERSSGAQKCLHCSYTSDTFPSCANCHDITFRTVGSGTEKVEENIAKIFPYARIARVDRNTMEKSSSYKKLYDDFHAGKIDILIGTQMSTKSWYNPRLTLASIIDMDSILGSYDFDAHEKAYGHILQLSTRLPRHGSLVIQVFNNIHEVLLHAQKHTWHDFYEEECSMRNILKLPPFAHIIKCTYQSPDKNLCDKILDEAYEELTQACAHDTNLIISEPHDPLVTKVRTSYRKQIVIKITQDTIPQKLHDFLIARDHKWIIDVNPVQLI